MVGNTTFFAVFDLLLLTLWINSYFYIYEFYVEVFVCMCICID